MKTLLALLIGLLTIVVSQAQERTRPEGNPWTFTPNWSSQNQFINANGLGRCYDIRRIDPLKWAQETLGTGRAEQIVEFFPEASPRPFSSLGGRSFVQPKGVVFTSDVRGDAQTSTKFIQSAYDFENTVLSEYSVEVSSAAKIVGSAKFSAAFKDTQRSSSSSESLTVYTKMYKQFYKLDLQMNDPGYKHYFSDRFYDWVKRIGDDVTPEGFIHNFGTHYSSTAYYGGNFLQMRTVNKSSYAYSTKSESEYKVDVEVKIKAVNVGAGTVQGSSSAGNSSNYEMFSDTKAYTVGGDFNLYNPEVWANTVQDRMEVVNARLSRISDLLTPANFPNIPDINRKQQLLQAVIIRYENEANANRSRPQNGTFFDKQPIQFIMTVNNIKCVGGNEDFNQYYGQVNMGFFNAGGQPLMQNLFWSHGETSVDGFNRGDSKALSATLSNNVSYQDFERGYVSIWGNMTEQEGAANQVDNSNVVTTVFSAVNSTVGALQTDVALGNVSYTEDRTKVYFSQALGSSQPVTQRVNFTSSAGDNVEFTYTLQRVDQNAQNNYIAQIPSAQQMVEAASSGNIQQVKDYADQGGSFDNQPGALNTMIQTKNLVGLNTLMDLGARPETSDLDMALAPPTFDRNVVLALLERGARPTDAQFESSLQFNDPGVTKAFLREGVTPKLNHMQLAIANDQKELVYTFMNTGLVSAGPGELDYAVRKNDVALAQMMIRTGAQAQPTSLLTAISNNNQPMADLLIPVTPASHEALEASAIANNAVLFKLFIDKGSRLTNNNPVNIAIDNQNLQVLDMALKAGGDPNAGLAYAISKSNTPAFVTCLQNQAVPDPGFAYVVALNDKPLYDRMLNEFNGNADVALGQAITANKLDFGQSAIATGRSNSTAQLAAVAAAGSLPWSKLLIESGHADSNVGMMPAIEAQKPEVLDYLLSKGANGSDANYLAKSAELKNITMVKLLVEKGNANPENGKAAAIASGDVAITRYLLQKGALANGLAVPAAIGDIAMVKLLLEFKANPTEGVRAAVEANQTDVAVLLLESGAAVDGLMPIAANNGNKQIVEKLLAKGANPTDGIKAAITKNFTEVAIILLNAGASPNGVIDIAAGFGNKEVVGKLLEKGANANDGIKQAVTNKHIDVSKQLIDAGANVKDVSFMLIAVNNKQADMARLLHAKGTDVEYVDGKGNSFLHMAADGNGEYALTKAFIEFGLPIDRPNNKGETALHLAVQSGKDNMEVIQILVESGADVNAVNKDDKTVQRVAKSSKVKKYLKDNGSVRKVK
jgi:ankyrin repeat protein